MAAPVSQPLQTSSPSSPAKQLPIPVRRAVALILLCLAVYVAVGSLMFGGWWYGFVWDGKFTEFRWTALGIKFLVSNHPAVVTSIVLGCLTLFAIILLVPRKLFHLLDRFFKPIVVASVAVIAAAFLLVYLMPGNVQEYLEMLPIINAAPGALDAQLEARLEQPDIVPPVYFHYLNEDAIGAFYNQLRPELEETSRNIKSASESKAGAELGADGAKLNIEGDKSSQKESKYDRSNFSPERKCLEVMKYVRQTWPTSYYTDYWGWYSKYTTLRILRAGSETEWDPSDPLSPSASSDPQDVLNRAAETSQRFVNKLKEQLSTARGLVFVDGDFDESVRNGSVLLIHALAGPPNTGKLNASFRITVPQNALRSMPKGKPLRLTIFGEVIKPLGNDGVVSVAPVAIF